MSVGCPFCAEALDLVEDVELGPGETGGMYRSREYRCGGCGCAVRHRVVDKLWSRHESIELDVVPRDVGAAPPAQYACPRCSGHLRSAALRGSVDPPLESDRTRLTRDTDHLCDRCGGIFKRFEKGRWDAPAVVGWNVLARIDVHERSTTKRFEPVTTPARLPGSRR